MPRPADSRQLPPLQGLGARPGGYSIFRAVRQNSHRFAAPLPPHVLHWIDKLKITERLPGWRGRYFHGAITVAHYEFTAGASIREHHHPQEELYEVLEGELELSVNGVTQAARPGVAAVVPCHARHSVRALTDGRAIIVDSPTRPEFA